MTRISSDPTQQGKPRLEEWSVTKRNPSPWTAPEVGPAYLQGKVYNHPKYDDGEQIVTSRIMASAHYSAMNGHEVKCGSRTYVLGQVDPKYLAWLAERGIKFDPLQPVKVKDSDD